MPEEATDTQTEDLSIEALFEQAEAEVESLATDTDVESDSPADETEAVQPDEQSVPSDETEDSEQVDSDDEFDFDIDEDEEESPDETPTVDLETKIEVKGHGEQTIAELRDGYMRQADYTRGKQTLKAEREQFEAEQTQAAKIMETLQDDPVGVAAYLAVETGLMTQEQLDKVRIADLRESVSVPKADEIQQMIDAKVQEQLESHPDIQEARLSKVRAAIESEFTAIGEEIGKPLSEKARTQIIEYANEHDLMDLRVAFNALSAEAARKAKAREAVKKTATERPKTRGGVTATPPAKPDSIAEAMDLALAEHGES